MMGWCRSMMVLSWLEVVSHHDSWEAQAVLSPPRVSTNSTIVITQLLTNWPGIRQVYPNESHAVAISLNKTA